MELRNNGTHANVANNDDAGVATRGHIALLEHAKKHAYELLHLEDAYNY